MLKSLRVFVASSGDVQEERDRMPAVIDRLNRTLRASGLVLELWRWEESARIGLHAGGPQALIDPDLREADIVVLIAWNRFGPGVASELEQALARWKSEGRPQLLPYFSRRPALFTSEEQCDQRKSVLRAKRAIESQGLIFEYDDIDTFERRVEEHLRQEALALGGSTA